MTETDSAQLQTNYMRLNSLFIAEVKGKGKAVFTNENIEANTIIEIAPVLVMSSDERTLLDQTLLHDYIFVWGVNQDQCALALGWISIYNHAYKSNSEYFMDFDVNSMFIKTVSKIKAGEEITINYNGQADDPKKVWFEVKD